MAKPTVAIRVSPELYQEVFGIAEDRDVSMTEALDMLIFRLRKGQVDAGAETKRKSKSPGRKRGQPQKRARKLKTADERFDEWFEGKGQS